MLTKTLASLNNTGTVLVFSDVPPEAKLKDCLTCGMCCSYPTMDLSTSDLLPSEWVEVKDGILNMKRHSCGTCALQDLTTKKCTVYTDPRRPKVCSTFRHGQDRICYE